MRKDYRMVRGDFVELSPVRMAFFDEVEIVIIRTRYPLSLRCIIGFSPYLCLDVFDRPYRSFRKVDAYQLAKKGKDMTVGIVEAGDNRFSFTVDHPRIRSCYRIQLFGISREKYPAALYSDNIGYRFFW